MEQKSKTSELALNAIRGEASLDYFFKKDGMSMWDVNLNVHYLFPITEKIKVYPLAGLTFTNWRYEIAWDFEDAFEGWYLDEEDYEESKLKFYVDLEKDKSRI